MQGPIVATKLYAPKPPPRLVERARLTHRLGRDDRPKLTLVSAPAGFGKTTLLAEWLAAGASEGHRNSWLSLDQSDNEPAAFWSHVIVALQAAAPDFGAALLEAEGQGSDGFLASLVNELNGLPASIDLLLDDYHFIDHASIESGMAFLVEHLPPHVHLIISTRADPALPLARLRARGELIEVRSADLRFTDDETARYLNGAMDLGLSVGDVATLEQRTEGWIAALQLAALSVRSRDDVTAFIASFAGNDRYIVDYLVEEVLERQPDEVRAFLCRTCFLDRLSAPLCDAVTGTAGSRAMLDALDRGNLFLVPLDDRRQWYRYHHLFADVLLTHFADEMHEELPVLQRRAGDWYETQGERSEAVRHMLAARDFARAAELIELGIPDLSKHRRDTTMRDWLAALPDEIVRQRPVLGVAFVGVLASIGALDEIERRLGEAEQAITLIDANAAGAEAVVVVDQKQFRALPAAIAMYRAAMAQVRGDLEATIEHARQAIALSPPDEHLSRAGASGFLGIALWTRGELDAAYESWTVCAEGLRRGGRIADVFGASRALADIRLTQGRLGDAARIYERALDLAREQGDPGLRGVADMHAGLSGIYLERNDLAAAHEQLQKSEELGEHAGMPQHRHRWRIAIARLRQAEGDIDGALALLDDAERVFIPDFFPNVRPIAAMRARAHIAQGKLGEAKRWQRESGVTVEEDLSYLREFEHITLARLILADVPSDDRLPGLLDRLRQAAEHGGRNGGVIEICILQALASRARGDAGGALAPLKHALSLAEPEGYVRIFVDEGEPMAALLKAAAKRGLAPNYVRHLMAAFGPAQPKVAQDHPDLIEPLSDRELDVLLLLRSDLDGPEIARELMVSLNTMRTHTKNIYEKLGVSGRRAAVRRAEELNLLHRGQRR